MTHKFIKLLLLLCAMCFVHLTHAHHGTKGQYYLEDLSGDMKFEDVIQNKDWKPFEEVLMLGYKDHPMWLKVYPHDHLTAQDLLVRVRPSYLDDVLVYLPKAEGYEVQKGGDLLPKDQMEIFDTAISFAWRNYDGRVDQPIYIRVQTSSTLAAHVQILPLVGMDRYLDSEKLVVGIYFGITLLVFFWSLGHGLWRRDVIFLSFALYLAFAFIMAAAILGYWGRFVVPFKSTNVMTSCAVIVNSVTGLLFQRLLLTSLGLSRVWQKVFDGLICVGVVAVAIVCTQSGGKPTQYLMQFNVLVMAFICFIQLFIVVRLQMAAEKLKRLLLMTYFAFAALVMFSIFPLLGLFNPGLWSLHVSILHGLMAAVLLGGVLVYRKKLEEDALKEAEADLIRVKAEANANRTLSEERENFLVMLAHEMRTPLSVIKMSVGSHATQSLELQADSLKDVQKAVQDMTSILNLSVQVDKLERGELPLQLHSADLSQLINDVALSHSESQRIQISVDKFLPPITIDPLILKTILVNLLENSLKYSPPQSVVSVHVNLMQESLLISVTNNVGEAGKPEPQKVFSKYYRAPGAYRSTGSGLGLYLVAGLVKMIGGEIRMLSTDADLVCFEVALKLVPHANA